MRMTANQKLFSRRYNLIKSDRSKTLSLFVSGFNIRPYQIISAANIAFDLEAVFAKED